MKVAQYIAQFLADHGVSDVFTVTGGGAMHLNDALGHHEALHCTFNHHEQACAIAAEAYTRMTGDLAAVCVTSGPGGTNAITGVMGGWVDSIPMFIISGQVKREVTTWSCEELGLRQLGDQEFDIIHSVSNMTKYAVMLTNPDEVAYHLEKALFLATHGRGGPVWIDVPLDVQNAQIETEALRHFDQDAEKPWEIPKVSPVAVRDILNKIQEAKAPLLLVGAGIRLGGAEELLLKLLDKLQIPVVTAWNSCDTVAYDSPWFAGLPGTIGTRPGNFAVQNCDLILILGCRLNLRMIGYNHFEFAQNAYKIMVDIDSRELMKPTLKLDLKIQADVKQVINEMLAQDYMPQQRHQLWVNWCRDIVKRYPAVLPSYHKSDGENLNPYVFIDALFERLENKDRIICGNGSACVVSFQAGKIQQGQRMFTNSGCAAMGYGLPAAVGVAVSDNSRRTICIDGDGSIMMNIQELATVVYNQLDIKIFIINNNGYHSIRQTQTNFFKPPYIGIDSQSGLGFPDFAKLAEAFGLSYYVCKGEENCAEIVEKTLHCKGPCICEVIVDPMQNFAPKSASKVLPDGRIVSPSLEDMAPFLDCAELESVKFNRN